MTVAEWLATRTPPPPSPLAERVRAMSAPDAPGVPRADALCEAAAAALADLVRRERLTRENALDLLAIDALVTYAFEAAADEPDAIEERATRAMARIAALAAPTPR